MEPVKLREVVEKHRKWLWGKPGGERADLSGADLRSADLRSADLSGAVLSGAVLRSADLRSAVLSGAVLRSAVLRSAVLSGAVLSGAVLRSADLSGAVLENVKVPALDATFVAELGRRAAGDNLEQQMWAGLLALHSQTYCWREWRKLAPVLPQAVEWLLTVVLQPWPESAAQARILLKLPPVKAVEAVEAVEAV